MNKVHELQAAIKGYEIQDNDVQLINQYTLSPVSKDDVFVFKIAMCDNEIDRDIEVFPRDSLDKLAELFKGKTMIADHSPRMENQIARIYDCYVEEVEGKKTSYGEQYCRLVGKVYMLRLDETASLIKQIEGGIKKEVSIGFRIGKLTCSICGQDRFEDPCQHERGQRYDESLCFLKMEDIVDAYEVSFVAVPAQREAGAIKRFGLEQPEAEGTEGTGPEEKGQEGAAEKGAPNNTGKTADLVSAFLSAFFKY